MSDSDVAEGHVTSLDGSRIGFLRRGSGPGLMLVQGAMGTAFVAGTAPAPIRVLPKPVESGGAPGPVAPSCTNDDSTTT